MTKEMDFKWYVIHTFSGHENKVKLALEKKISGLREQMADAQVELENAEGGVEKENLAQKIEMLDQTTRIKEVKIPTVEVAESTKDGKKKIRQKKFFPGYVLIKMELNDETWSIIKSITGVTNFVGAFGSNKPRPLSQSEVDSLFDQTGEQKAREKASIAMDFSVGEHVRVIEGPFNNFSGVVEEVSPEKGKLRVKVEIFGRGTPVELDFIHVTKI